MKKVIEAKNLVKRYGNFSAVKGISFDVNKGEIFGLLGENGAGKTTTLEIIEGLRKPTEGTVEVLGHDVCNDIKSVKERIGVQLQSSAYYNFLSLKEILELFGGFYSKRINADSLLDMVELREKANQLVGNLSGGQKQRFSIIASLVNDPDIVFLDEPTTGLDPLARRNLWNLITDIKKQGKTIILTTHYMEEAEILCDRIAIMEKGKILVSGQTHDLIENTENPYRITITSSRLKPEVEQKLAGLGQVEKLTQTQGYEIKIKTKTALHKALNIITPLEPENIAVGHASLEDLFIELTGKTIEE